MFSVVGVCEEAADVSSVISTECTRQTLLLFFRDLHTNDSLSGE